MLVGDRAKYLLLVSALTFSALLITQQSSVFLGLLRWTTATLRNTQIPVWVVDPLVEQVNEVQPLRDTDLTRVRSVDGVAWAVPFSSSILQARLDDGNFKMIQLIGLDSTTLIGGPAVLLSGSLDALWQNNAVIIDQVAVERLSIGRARPMQVGDTFEINDHEARIVGICKAERSFFGYPYVFTTYEKAMQFAPSLRKSLGFILVMPQEGITPTEVSGRIEKETGLKAFTEDKFRASTVNWFFKNTGIPSSFGTIILMGFLVGVAVAGQTFYSFVIENLRYFGALKAMGASNFVLCKMLIFQAFLAGFLGYGIGVGLVSLFGRMAIKAGFIPFYMPAEVLIVSSTAIFAICMFSATLGILKIRKLEAAEVFRG
jgi:putative ABC transport system permease protein